MYSEGPRAHREPPGGPCEPFSRPDQTAGPVKQNKRAHRKPQRWGEKRLGFFSLSVKIWGFFFPLLCQVFSANAAVSRGMTERIHVDVLLAHGALESWSRSRCRSHTHTFRHTCSSSDRPNEEWISASNWFPSPSHHGREALLINSQKGWKQKLSFCHDGYWVLPIHNWETFSFFWMAQ